MNENKSYDYLIESINYELLDDIIFSLTAPLDQRYGYENTGNIVKIPRVMTRLIGIKETQTKYYEMLGALDQKLSKLDDLYIKVVNGLDRNLDILNYNKIEEIISKVTSTGEIDTLELITLLEERNLFPVLQNKELTSQLKDNFRGIFEYYKTELESNKNKLVDTVLSVVHFMNYYLPSLFLNFDYYMINPKIVYYGNIKEDEILFLLIAGSLGCDVLYLNPKDDGGFIKVDKLNIFSKEKKYEFRGEIKENPFSDVYKHGTEAFKANEEIKQHIFNEDTGIFMPWQLSSHMIESNTMNTIYTEIGIIAKEEASVRQGFKVDSNKVYIPNIFAKVSGTHKDVEKYFEEISNLTECKNTEFIGKLPYMKSVHLEYGKFEQIYPSRGYKYFDTNKLINATWWPYKDLRTGMQKNIANKIKDLCLNPIVKNIESVGIRDFQVDIFSVLLNMNVKLIRMLQAFDYPSDIPKLIVYNNEINGKLSYEDAIMFGLLNKIGFDIVIFNPSGYNDIENFYEPGIVNELNLETVKFSLEYMVLKKDKQKNKGFFKNLFN